MRRVAALLALLAVLALPACGGEVDPAKTGAGSAQKRFFEDLYAGRFGQVYSTLHPAHQKLVSRTLFVDCAKQTIAVDKLDSVEVLDVFDDDADVVGVDEGTKKAVRVRITSTSGQTSTLVNHEVKVGDEWRWVLNAAAVRAYRAGKCPGS